ncbi:hypothetical protein K378_01687 [Streptomyces sp. Amel2xB2]|nr:hypothetical protein K378_01687 [Streptomyces sp. Amel2xB2]
MQRREQTDASAALLPAVPVVPVRGVLLTVRLHVDLRRVCSAVCRG